MNMLTAKRFHGPQLAARSISKQRVPRSVGTHANGEDTHVSVCTNKLLECTCLAPVA
jgi:hypothetical protein